MNELTPYLISSLAGLLLSIGLEVIPKLNEWWASRWTRQQRSLIIVILMVFVGFAVYGLSCYSPYVYTTCDTDGAWRVANAVGLAIVAYVSSQAGHKGAKVFSPMERSNAD